MHNAAAAALCYHAFTYAQKISIDEIKKQCSGLAMDKRVRMTVSSFTHRNSANR